MKCLCIFDHIWFFCRLFIIIALLKGIADVLEPSTLRNDDSEQIDGDRLDKTPD